MQVSTSVSAIDATMIAEAKESNAVNLAKGLREVNAHAAVSKGKLVLYDGKSESEVAVAAISIKIDKFLEALSNIFADASVMVAMTTKQKNSYDAQWAMCLTGASTQEMFNAMMTMCAIASSHVMHQSFISAINKGITVGTTTYNMANLPLTFINNSSSAQGAKDKKITFSFAQALGYAIMSENALTSDYAEDFYNPFMMPFETTYNDVDARFFRSVVVCFLPVKKTLHLRLFRALCLHAIRAHHKFDLGIDAKNKTGKKKRNWATVFRKKYLASEKSLFVSACKRFSPRVCGTYLEDADYTINAPLFAKAEGLIDEIMSGKYIDLDSTAAISMIVSKVVG